MSAMKMVLTAVGPDRPGLVAQVAEIIHEAGGNLEDSRMAVLAGDFALIVLFSASPEAVERIRDRARDLEQEISFKIHLQPATPRPEEPDRVRFALEVTGVDQPGIVHKVSTVLADLEINVTSLESRLEVAAFAGTPMFTLRAEMQVPESRDIDRLTDELEQVCDALNLSCDLNPAGE